jgi:hypothetical protein
MTIEDLVPLTNGLTATACGNTLVCDRGGEERGPLPLTTGGSSRCVNLRAAQFPDRKFKVVSDG